MNKKNQNHIISISLVIFFILSVDLFLHPNISSAATLIGGISNDAGARGLEYNPSNDSIYFSYGASEGFVAAIDSSTNLLYSITGVGTNPSDIEYNPSNEDLYIVNSGSNTVSVLDSSNNTIGTTINVGDRPRYIEFNPTNEDVYVANTRSNNVSVIDSSTNMVIDTIDVGLTPFSIKYIPNSEDVYVGVGIDGDFGEPTEGYVVVIDSLTNNVEGIIGNVSIPLAMEVNPSNGKVYVANAGSNSVTIIDSLTRTVEDIINLNAPIIALQYNGANGDLYAAVLNQQSSRNNGFIAVIDGSSNIFKDVYAVGVSPRQIEYNPTDNNIYVANSGSGDVYVIDSESNTSTNLIPVSRGTTALEYNPSNHNIYLASSQDGESEAIKIIAPDRLTSDSPQDLQSQKVVEFIIDLLKESSSDISTNLLSESLDILTDNNPDNDMEICEILDANSDHLITPTQTNDLETILNC